MSRIRFWSRVNTSRHREIRASAMTCSSLDEQICIFRTRTSSASTLSGEYCITDPLRISSTRSFRNDVLLNSRVTLPPIASLPDFSIIHLITGAASCEMGTWTNSPLTFVSTMMHTVRPPTTCFLHQKRSLYSLASLLKGYRSGPETSGGCSRQAPPVQKTESRFCQVPRAYLELRFVRDRRGNHYAFRPIPDFWCLIRTRLERYLMQLAPLDADELLVVEEGTNAFPFVQ